MFQPGSVVVTDAVLWKFVEFSAKLRRSRSAEFLKSQVKP